MIVVFSTSVIAIILAYLSGTAKFSKLKLFELAFALITFIACIHYNYGTDYAKYYYMFTTMSQNPHTIDLIKSGYYKEPIWAYLNYLLPRPYGFLWIVAAFNLIQNYIYYRFISENMEERKRWISLALYLFLTNFYVLNFSMIRQGFTVALCLAAGMYATKKKWIPAVAIVLLASMVHLSALVFLPFIFMCFLPIKKGHIYSIVFLGASVVLFLFQDIVNKIFSLFSDNFSSISSYLVYTETMTGWGNTLGFGFLLSAITYVVFFYFMSKRFEEFEYKQKLFIVFSCVAFCVIPFQMNVTSIFGRIGTYFSVYQICTVPLVYSKIKEPVIRYTISFIFVFMMIVGYYRFFFTSWSATGYETYHSIFDLLW